MESFPTLVTLSGENAANHLTILITMVTATMRMLAILSTGLVLANAREKGTLSLDLRRQLEIKNSPTSCNLNAAKWLQVG